MLKNLKILIIGGSGDIGTACVEEFLKNNAKVTATYNSNKESLESFNNENLELVKLNVLSSDDIDKLCEKYRNKDLIPDVLIYNAGITRDTPVQGMTEEDFDQCIDINLKGAFLVSKAVCANMRRNKKGKVFFVSSVAGQKGGRGNANYSASKAGLEAFARSLAIEMAGKNILVNSIAPGVIKSRMTEDLVNLAQEKVLENITLKRLGETCEIAKFISHMCSDDITYITGQTFNIDGGFKL